jgi:RNA polymerase sigma factor (sigma-70 family)
MATAPLGAVLQHIHSLAEDCPNPQYADDELLHAFLARGDQAAFELILTRHGPMVLRVCRRVLDNLQDAEDAFQATFLFLAQQARSVRKKASLASWLHGVALRMATNARRSAARRTRHERQSAPAPTSDPAWQAAWHEVQSILDEEIQRLPETYREPLLRCCLEHRSCAEVAVHLRLREATVRSRVSRARKLLEQQLSRRGVSLTLLSTAVAVSGSRATAEVAPALLDATATAATHLASAQGLANAALSPRVLALLKGANQAMVGAKLKTTLVVLLGTMLLAGGTALVYGRALPAGRTDENAPQDAAPGLPADGALAARSQVGNGWRTDCYGDPLPDEALARLGTTRFRPGEPVRFLRFTPDGARLITQSSAGLRIWDAASGRELRRFGPALGKAVLAGDVSADGKLALTADADQHAVLRLWDTGTGRQLRECGNAGPFGPVCLAPDGKTIAALGPSGETELRDTTTGKRRHTLKGYPGNSLGAFSADSKTLVTGRADRTIRLWDVATGRQVRRIDCAEGVYSVILSPDGKLLASVGAVKEAVAPGMTTRMPDNRVRLWDAATGKELRQLVVPAKATVSTAIVACVFAPDSKTLVTLGMDYVLRVWDATTGKQLRSFSGCSTNSGALALTHDGTAAAIVNGGTALRIVDLATGKDRVPLAGHGGGVYDVAIAPDSRTVYTAGGDDSVCVWNAATGKEVRRLRGHDRWVSAVALSPDGRLLYSLGADRKLLSWDTTAGRVRQHFAGDYDAASSFGRLALSADGTLIAAGRVKGPLVLLDAVSVKPIRTVRGLEGQHSHGAGFAPDNCTLVAWLEGQKVAVIDVATAKTRKTYPFAGDQDTRSSYTAALSPDGRLLAFGSQGRFLSVLKVDTGKEVRRFEHLPDGVSAVAFSPDGRSLAWGGWNDPTVHLIELSTASERHRFNGHQGRILALHFSRDGKVLISGGNDGTALIWDLGGRPGAKVADRNPSAKELASLWQGLGAAAAPQAYQTVRRLARSPAAVGFLGKHVQPVIVPDARQVAKLIADLDSDDFQVREKATKELERHSDGVAGACRKALADRPSLEQRRRLEKLLDRQAAEAQQPSAERVRLVRALEVLELAGTGRARELLVALAKGAPGAWLTEQAKATVERLDRRKFKP